MKYVEVIDATEGTLLDRVESEYVDASFGTTMRKELVVGGNLTR
jgi:hypothetical protein